jgi:hypothetical protein
MRNRECEQWIQKDVGGKLTGGASSWHAERLAKTTKKFFSLESAAVQRLCTYANLLCSEVQRKGEKITTTVKCIVSEKQKRLREFTFCSNSCRPQNNSNTPETRTFLFMCVFVFVLCVLLCLLSCAISFIAFLNLVLSVYMPCRRLGGRGSVAPTHSWPHPYLVSLLPLFLT